MSLSTRTSSPLVPPKIRLLGTYCLEPWSLIPVMPAWLKGPSLTDSPTESMLRQAHQKGVACTVPQVCLLWLIQVALSRPVLGSVNSSVFPQARGKLDEHQVT